MILDSIASPAAAATGGCYLFVVRLARNGNSGNANQTAVSDTVGCATTVSGVAGCTTYTRITANGSNPPGTLTLAASYSDALPNPHFHLVATLTTFPMCGIVGTASTPGTGTATPCAAAVGLTDLGGAVDQVTLDVNATDTNNVIAWAYLAVQC